MLKLLHIVIIFKGKMTCISAMVRWLDESLKEYINVSVLLHKFLLTLGHDQQIIIEVW